ncbi:MAG TPA: hypothetical protein VMU56_06395, partial [Beijerinckiaceae bacterium]|nr:hypothetical protein [Beijerinckiaceae bacterium]
LRAAMARDIRSRIGYLLARPAFQALRDKLDPRSQNGAVFLGLDGIVIKSHGGADAVGFAGAVGIGYEMVRHEFLDQIRHSLSLSQQGRAPTSTSAAPAQTAGEGHTLSGYAK